MQHQENSDTDRRLGDPKK